MNLDSLLFLWFLQQSEALTKGIDRTAPVLPGSSFVAREGVSSGP